MEDLQKALNSVNLYGPNATNNYSGAGANAVSRADWFSATIPLSEVVWSPRRGLSLRRADHSLIENKVPALWNSEVYNIAISPPPTAGGKSDSGGFMPGANSTNIGLQPCSEHNVHHEVTHLGPPQDIVGVVQSCPIWSHVHSPGTFKEMKTTNSTSVVNVTNADHRGDSPSANEEGSTSVNMEKGPEDGGFTDHLSHKPEVTSSLAQLETGHRDSNEESLRVLTERDLQANGNQCLAKDETLAYNGPMFNRQNCLGDVACGTRFKDGKQRQFGDTANENYVSGLTSGFSSLHPLVENCAQTSGLKEASSSKLSALNFLVEAKSDHYNHVKDVTSEHSNEGKKYIHSIHQEDKSPLVESPLDQCKVKERVSSTGRSRSIPREKSGSHESVESSNSAGPFVSGKRKWSFGEENIEESKRMKKSSDESSCSGPHVREDSSFMNWISSMTKCVFRPHHVETHSSTIFPNSVQSKERDLFSASTSNASNKDAACRSMYFGSIFNALHWPRLKGNSKEIVSIDHPGEFTNARFHFDNMTIRRNTDRLICDDEGIKLYKPIPMSSVRTDQICHFGEPPPVESNIPVSHPLVQEKMKDTIREQCYLHNMGPSYSSLRNGSSSPSEGTIASKHGSFTPNVLSNLSTMNKAGRIPSSVWITRFLPKVAASLECTTQCNQGAFLEAEKHIDDCIMSLHHAQNDINSFRNCNDPEDGRHSPLENQRPTSEHLQHYSIGPMGSEKVHTDLKAKLNLTPILPSQKMKKLEAMTSVFAKRLDAFRHIQTSDVADDMTPESVTCFFCGKNSHVITSCSDVIESEFEELLKNFNLLGRIEKTTCICIRCFQHDHWGVVCPYASLNSFKHANDNASIVKFENFVRPIKGINDAPLSRNYGGRVCQKREDCRDQILNLGNAHRIVCGHTSRDVTESMLHTNVNQGEKRAMKGKQIASTSGKTELGDKSSVLLHGPITMKKADEQPRIFERIRKLRLSRTDAIRWMESSTSQYTLEGFFLRVKLGKRGEGLGGTCYHVACISGPSGEIIYGGRKSPLPVNIGGSKYLIDHCFISNHDFVEDELKAWWSATLLSGSKLPSEEYLDNKLSERDKLGL